MLKPNSIATCRFGSTDRYVTPIGLGGEGVLRTYGRTPEAQTVIQAALHSGIQYFDSAPAYADSETYYGSLWQQQPQTRSAIFQASKSASRDKRGAMEDLKQSLRRLGTDYLDLWQIHDIRTVDDFAMIQGPGGALEAFVEARASGKTRFIGVTGHHDPQILTKALEQWPVDAVMMPVNPIEGILGGFLTQALPTAQEKGIAVIAMKTLGASHYIQPDSGISAQVLIRYALSYDVTVAIVGCSTSEEVETLAQMGRNPIPLTHDDISRIHAFFRPQARSLAYYRGVM
jgi:aryl-alcohol dehydrogenase-like predicted oxidoreductase